MARKKKILVSDTKQQASLRDMWVGEAQDYRLSEIGDNEAAFVWEALRHLYFTEKLSSFWLRWVNEKPANMHDADRLLNEYRNLPENDGYEFPVVFPRLSRALANEDFPGKSWNEFDKRKSIWFTKTLTNWSGAVRTMNTSKSNYLLIADWAMKQFREAKDDRPFLPPPIEWFLGENQGISRLILEVDWNHGIEAIARELKYVISRIGKNRYPNGRKSRKPSVDRLLKGLVLLRRREIKKLPWKEARCVKDCKGNGKDLFASKERTNPTAARSALQEAEKKLVALKSELSEEEALLLNGWKWPH